MAENIKLGHNSINLFQLEENYFNLNSGSYGIIPKYVLQKYREYQDKIDKNTEKYFRYFFKDQLNETREAISEYVNADVSNIVLVHNATDGINTILKSMLKRKQDKLLIFSVAFGTVKKTAKYLKDTIGIEVIEIYLDEETLNSDEKILEKLNRCLKTNSDIKLASIDHISSTPVKVFPVEPIIKVLRDYGIPVFIDGAHAAGQIPLNLKEMNPDFYISNFHKWCYSPKSCCFLYVSPNFHTSIHSNSIAKLYESGFTNEFSYTGCRDYAPYLSVRDAIEFRKKIGEENIINYNNNLAIQVGNLVSKIWGTELLIKAPQSCAMVDVRIPCVDDKIIEEATKKLMLDYNISTLTYKFTNEKYYARFSSQIINEINDYKYGAETFLRIITDLLNNKNKSNKMLNKYGSSPKF